MEHPAHAPSLQAGPPLCSRMPHQVSQYDAGPRIPAPISQGPASSLAPGVPAGGLRARGPGLTEAAPPRPAFALPSRDWQPMGSEYSTYRSPWPFMDVLSKPKFLSPSAHWTRISPSPSLRGCTWRVEADFHSPCHFFCPLLLLQGTHLTGCPQELVPSGFKPLVLSVLQEKYL